MSSTMSLTPLVRPPDAVVSVPGSKSHTNRALVCAALADGPSRLSGALFADDTRAMMSTLSRLGIEVSADPEAATVGVVGTGGRLPAGPAKLDVGQSGTTGRFVLPMLGLGSGRYELDGDEQLRRRPFGDLLSSLGGLGVRTEGTELPLVVHGRSFEGGTIEVAGSVSSQFLSGLLLSAPCADREVIITVDGDLVSKPYVDLTLSTMAMFGARVERHGHRQFAVAPTGYRGADIDIEPDASAASYFFGAAAITGGRVRVDGLGAAAVQGDLRFIDALERMGAVVDRGPDYTEVRGPHRLGGITIDMADMSDTAQTLAVVATFASSPTRIDGIGFIRRKETDRIGAVVTELKRLGIEASEHADGMSVRPGRPNPGLVHTYDDHRMAMSFALFGLVHDGIEIENAACVNKTFPEFFAVLDELR